MPDPYAAAARKGFFAFQTATIINYKQTIIDAMMLPATQKIDFWLGAIHVDSAGFAVVANALRRGSIGVAITDLDANTAAAYNPGGNFFKIRTPTFGVVNYEIRAIIHECVHAMQDIGGQGRGSASTSESENEAAAYIAGALLYIYVGETSNSEIPIYIEADYIANLIKGKKGAVVPVGIAGRLRAQIAANPTYINSGVTFNSPSNSDGVP